MACSTIASDPRLPEQRPADFRIAVFDVGGMLPESEHYFIAQDSAGRESFFEEVNNRWTFVPDPAQLDAFYEKLRALKPTDIHVQDQELVHDRGGVSIQLDFDQHHFGISNSGSSFVMEKDMERFSDVKRNVVSFVRKGLEPAKIPCTLILESDLPHAVEEQNSVEFNHLHVLEWSRPQPTVYADSVVFELLPGEYLLQARQTLAGKMFSIHEKVKVDAAHNSFHILLKNDTFELKQQ